MRFRMLDYISRPNDVYTFVSQDETTLVPPFSCAYNNGRSRMDNVLSIYDTSKCYHVLADGVCSSCSGQRSKEPGSGR